MNVMIEDSSEEYIDMFLTAGFNVVNKIDHADLVCFTGGEDVCPEMYGDERHPYTFTNGRRDQVESTTYYLARKHKIPMVGICRGGQFLNVMNGGRMYQHVTNHGRPHYITDLQTGETVYVSSTHHQMMKPGSGAIIVATSVDVMSEREWYDQTIFRKDVTNEGIEVVHYPDTDCLCFQPHPEFFGEQYTGMTNYFFSLVERFLTKAHA